MDSSPKLIESSTRSYLYNILQKCHSNRVSVYYYVLNIGVLILFLGTTFSILYFCNKYKLTDYEKNQKMIRDQQYVLSKIRYYKEVSNKKQDSEYSSITGLPFMNADKERSI
jgi:hypothetical protein